MLSQSQIEKIVRPSKPSQKGLTEMVYAIQNKTRARKFDSGSALLHAMANSKKIYDWDLVELAHFVSQVCHESGNLRYMEEIWGPTAQQLRYERDFSQPFGPKNSRNKLAYTLGNYEKGDGSKFRGRGLIMITGRENYTKFDKWSADQGFSKPGDFLEKPEKISEDPSCAGLVAVWFWDFGYAASSLDTACRTMDGSDANVLGVTRIINGGTNGLDDRKRLYWRAGCVLLGLDPDKPAEAQEILGVKPDGIVGPMSRGALHQALEEKDALGEAPSLQTETPVMTPESSTQPGVPAGKLVFPHGTYTATIDDGDLIVSVFSKKE